MSRTNVPIFPKELEKQAVMGPALPSHLLKRQSSKDPDVDTAEDQQSQHTKGELGSASSESNKSYGPALPPSFQKTTPQVNNDDNDSDEDYGPLPAGVFSTSLAQQALEERALQMKLDLLQGVKHDQAEVREKWMLELPNVGGAHLGLGPRQFRKNERPDFSDRSSWTDTPEEKAKKMSGKHTDVVDLKKDAEMQKIAKRNAEKDKLIADYNKKKKRDKSLVQLHQEKLKKKKMDDGEASTSRRPFNREIDLKVNQFDAAQKKSIMRNAMHLDDRFSRGQSKYL